MAQEVPYRHAALHGIAEVTRGHAVPLGVSLRTVEAIQPDAQLDGAPNPAVDAGAVGEEEVIVAVDGEGNPTAPGLALESGPAFDGVHHEEVVIREVDWFVCLACGCGSIGGTGGTGGIGGIGHDRGIAVVESGD